MVNRELFLQIADRIEKEPENYDQRIFGVCDTSHCVAGWAIVLSGQSISSCGGAITSTAREKLGIEISESNELFNEHWKPRPGLTVPDALRLIANGASVVEVSANG